METLLITTWDGLDEDVIDGSDDGDGGRSDDGDNGDYKKVVLQKLLITTREGKVDDGKDDDDFGDYHGDGHRMVVEINYDDDDDSTKSDIGMHLIGNFIDRNKEL